MAYNHITEEERILIYRWGKEHKSINEIGRLLKRFPSSISRELNRNTGGKGYRSKQAHAKAQERAKRKRRHRCPHVEGRGRGKIPIPLHFSRSYKYEGSQRSH